MAFSFFRAPLAKLSVDTSPRTHEVAGRVLPLKIVENPRARRLTLRIDAGGKGLRVTVPPKVPTIEVDRFISRHQDWLESRITKIPVVRSVSADGLLPLRGVDHQIVHEPDKRGITHVVKGENGQPQLIVFGSTEHLPRRIADFLKKEVKCEIEMLVAKHTSAVGRKATAVRFKDTKSRWGSCTSRGVLSFSWRIGMAPPPVINYLVAHEVAHLIEMNHGPAFWKLCHELCPDTVSCRNWLTRNGAALQAIEFS
ncbi:M48 family metallopeptidase [Brucellaceae bacterium C25G]